jgi:rRNA-processing protein FCF1
MAKNTVAIVDTLKHFPQQHRGVFIYGALKRELEGVIARPRNGEKNNIAKTYFLKIFK